MISHDNLTWTAGVCCHLYQLCEVGGCILSHGYIAIRCHVTVTGGSHDQLPTTQPHCSTDDGKQSALLRTTLPSLPLQDIHAPLQSGLTIHFARPDALKGTLLDTLKVTLT